MIILYFMQIPNKFSKKFISTFQHLLPYLKQYKKWIVLSILFIAIKEVAMLSEPVIYKAVISTFESVFKGSLAKSEAVHLLIQFVILFALLQLGQLIAHALLIFCTNRFQSSVMRDAANDFVEKVLRLSFRFHTERKTGKISKEYARGISAVETFMDTFVFNLIPLVIRIGTILVIFFFVQWKFALVLLLMVVAFCVFSIYTIQIMQKRREQVNVLDDEGARKAMDALMNAEAVKYFQQEEKEIRSFRMLRQRWKNTKQHEWDGYIWLNSGQIAINAIAAIGILILLIQNLLADSLALSDFIFIISYLGFTIGMLWDFQNHIRRFQEALTDLNAFFYYFVQENEILDATDAKDLQIQEGKIEFDHVNFRYQDGKQILKNVSFTIETGKRVAFVGPSGVGKSTIMKLLYRFYDAQSGNIFIDGQKITEITQQSLRSVLGIVPQETALFNETIGYNIAYGSKNAKIEDIQRAAKLAHADTFIQQLPKGYETLVGERGVKLSGGEKQRISIARAFLHDAPILILDEATASLDSQAETEIQESLQTLMKGRTTLIIAHRLSTIMSADVIIVMNEGGVEQVGTHEELLENGGLYQRLWELQAGGYIV